jgi:hypothetical protein
MDATKLAVGQDVHMYPGCSGYGYWKGKVVKSTSSGLEVQLEEPVRGESLIRFGYWGTELIEDWGKWCLAPEQHPWTLDEIPFAERTASIEQAVRESKERTK